LEAKVKESERELGSHDSDTSLDHQKKYELRNSQKSESNDNADVESNLVTPNDGTMIAVADHGMTLAPEPEYVVRGPGAIADDNLAVAIAITEEDDPDLFHAEEYDPDAKPPIIMNRRFRLYSIAACCMCMMFTGLIIAVIIFFRGDPLVPSEVPSNPPTALYPLIQSAEAGNDVSPDLWIDELHPFAGDAIYEANTIEYLTAQWLLYEDPQQLQYYDQNLIQRYRLAYFCMKTTDGGKKPWRSCNKPGPEDNSTCVHLRFNRRLNNTIEYRPEEGIRWLSGEHECDWVGNTCDDNKHTRALSLVGQNITGPLPTNLAQFPLLQSLRVSFNEFTGTLPTAYAGMKQLLSFEVHGNQFSGTFPNEYFSVTSLQNLNIGDNYFTGTLSSLFSQLTNLKGLHTFSNFFTGHIPSELFHCDYLSFTRHNDNIFNGTIPSSIGRMSQLQELLLDSNQLTGTIPKEIGLMTNLIYFSVGQNKLIGSIPNELFNIKYLQTLDLRTNYLTGTIDNGIAKLEDLRYLYLSRNQFRGTITPELGKHSLDLAWFHLNNFEGTIPESLCDLNMEVLQTDCFPRDNAPHPCPCCTSCCNRKTELCLIRDDDNELEFI